MRKEIKMKGYTLHLIPTDKFKTTTISSKITSHIFPLIFTKLLYAEKILLVKKGC